MCCSIGLTLVSNEMPGNEKPGRGAGFGIVNPEHVTAVRPYGDAVAVGTAIVDLLNRTPSAQQSSALSAYVTSLRAACDERARDTTVTPA